MFIYVWSFNSIPFYVGLTKNIRRANPRNNGGRNWLCRQRLNEVGPDSVHVEIQHVADVLEGQNKERELITLYGRVDLGTGTLTNLRVGGEGMHIPTQEHREKLRVIMLAPNHPIRSKESREKQAKRMRDPDVKARFLGENNPSKKPEVRAKLKALWENPDFRAARIKERLGVPKNFSEADLAKKAKAVKDNPNMKNWGERNGKDAEFDAKRIEGIRAAQPKRAEKMRDPVALAQRKARLTETLNSPEHKARRAAQNTPEYRAAASARKKEYWARKRAESVT
jgi:hypothetical protein